MLFLYSWGGSKMLASGWLQISPQHWGIFDPCWIVFLTEVFYEIPEHVECLFAQIVALVLSCVTEKQTH